jgi:electron transfer flavoprotein beta subunit
MVAVAVEVDPAARRLVVRRELEGAVEIVETQLPAVVGAQRGLNTPRYPTLPNIMKARRQPIAVMPLGDLGLDPVGVQERRRLRVMGYEEAPRRAAGQRLSGEPAEVARELVARLHREAQVL